MQLQTERQPMPMTWVDRLFMRLSAMYGQKFAAQWAGIDGPSMKAVWAEDLSGMSGTDIAAGLDACKSRPFPPTLPEFILLCRPGMDPATAHAEAVLGMQERKRGHIGAWSHPAVYWAATHVGAHDLLSQGYVAIRGRWEKALRDSWAKGVWDAIPEPALALPAPGKDVVSNEEGRKHVEQLSAKASKTEKADHKAWARKIVAAPKGRSPTVLAMARAALDLEAA